MADKNVVQEPHETYLSVPNIVIKEEVAEELTNDEHEIKNKVHEFVF